MMSLAAAPAALAASKASKIPVALELYSVRELFQKDVPGVLKAVSKMGYAGVEFYGPYADWKPDYAKEVRKMIDDLNLKCFSTHTGNKYFQPAEMDRVIELNKILGSKYIVMSSAGRPTKLDDWKKVAEQLNAMAAKLKPMKMSSGYHNHQVEFQPLEGTRPIELIAKETTKDVVLQLDVGTVVEVGGDPVAWINQNPKRLKSIHLKDFKKGMATPREGYRVLLGEGSAPWKEIAEAAVKKGGVEVFIVEQEGSAHPPLETVEKCLQNFKKIVS